MQKQKKIGFVGVKKQDICVYFAAVLNNLGYQVLVEDLSYELEILSCIPELPKKRISYIRKMEEEMSAVAEEGDTLFEKRTYKNVDYVGGTEEQEEEYDYILINLGEWAQSDRLKKLDEIIVVTDCEKQNVEKYRKFLRIFSLPMCLVVRNVHEFHRENRLLVELFEMEEWNLTDKVLLPFDLKDEEYRVSMQYEPYQEFRKISEEMNAMLIKFGRDYTENKMSELLFALRQARRGKCIR